MQWQPGHRLKNRPYEIERELGQGGFGITYKAKSLSLDIPVVIKTPNSRLQKDINYPKFVANFQKEARQLAKLGLNPHPHIVRVSSLFQEENLPCIVMDFVPGESLYDLVQTQGKLAEIKALNYIKQIGSALIVCHSAGIIHRDVHPNNILIHALYGQAVLIDFGIAGNTQTSRNTHSGNRAFAPWEQIAYWEQQNSKTPQVDIYTLAASLYYLVTGEVPTECLARKYKNLELIEPKQLNPNVSETVNKAILKGMEVNPKNRPSSMQEWLDLLVTVPQTQEKRKQDRSKKEIHPTFVAVREQPFDVITVNDRGQKIKREEGKAKYFTENLGNGVTLDLVSIPGDKFLMGTEDEEIKRLVQKFNWKRFRSENPQHEVTVQPFFMGKYPVTQAQWRAIASLPKVNRDLNPEPSFFKGDNRPVEEVSWYDAVEFCQRLSRETGREYRLPSEAEWEYACRAGNTTPFHFGETITTKLANYNGNTYYASEIKGENRNETTSVGSFPPNTFGLYDMHGNVWEWCEDDWHGDYQGAPMNGSAWLSGSSVVKVIRGGSWYYYPVFCRSASRFIFTRFDRNNDFGFRVVCVAPRAT